MRPAAGGKLAPINYPLRRWYSAENLGGRALSMFLIASGTTSDMRKPAQQIVAPVRRPTACRVAV
jgi:hypothetical protein